MVGILVSFWDGLFSGTYFQGGHIYIYTLYVFIYIYIPRESKDQTLPIGSRESFIWIILKTILSLVLDFQGISNPIQMGLRFLTLKPQKIGRKTQLSQSRIGAGLPGREPGLWDFQHLAIEKSLEFFQLKTPPNCISWSLFLLKNVILLINVH